MKHTGETGAGDTVNTKKYNVRFSAADVVIILLLIISVASIIIRCVSDSASFGSKTDSCRVEFNAAEVRYTTYDALEAGGDVYLGDELIGRLVEQPAYSPAVLHTSGADGAPIDVHYPENTKIEINGAIECELVATDGGYVTPKGVHIAPGCELTLKFRTVDLTVTVTSLTNISTDK